MMDKIKEADILPRPYRRRAGRGACP